MLLKKVKIDIFNDYNRRFKLFKEHFNILKIKISHFKVQT